MVSYILMIVGAILIINGFIKTSVTKTILAVIGFLILCVGLTGWISLP